MFLLIPSQASEKTQLNPTLHSTMFLLIRYTVFNYPISMANFTFHNVSINTNPPPNLIRKCELFTFHNVSINTGDRIFGEYTVETLHSTMFLLIHMRSAFASGQ